MTLGAALGGTGFDDDSIIMYVRLYADAELTVPIGDPLPIYGARAAERAFATALVSYENGTCGASIAGARYAEVTITPSYDGAPWFALADNISLVFTQRSAKGPNLIRDGDAETGSSNWIEANPTLTVAAVAGLGERVAVAECPGTSYFTGSGSSDDTVAYQLIDVCDYNVTIDAGIQPFYLSAWIGGFDTELESFVLSVEWQRFDEVLGTATLGPVTPTMRSDYAASCT